MPYIWSVSKQFSEVFGTQGRVATQVLILTTIHYFIVSTFHHGFQLVLLVLVRIPIFCQRSILAQSSSVQVLIAREL